MGATVIPVGFLKQYVAGQRQVEVQAGPTVVELLEELGIPGGLVALVMVNGAYQPKSYQVQEGDIVKLVPVVGGG
jgi:sulfur carrier protein ThiS